MPRQPGLIPLKFLVPGTVFLVAFQIAPILYTVNVAFTNYSTGHIISKADGDHAIKTELAPARAERDDVHDGGRARQERRTSS